MAVKAKTTFEQQEQRRESEMREALVSILEHLAKVQNDDNRVAILLSAGAFFGHPLKEVL